MKPYTEKHNARRAAKRHLGETAVEGTNFSIEPSGDGWRWKSIEAKQAPVAPQIAQEPKVAPTGRVTKGAKVLALLQRPGGATNAEMMEATGWQTHSVRGFLAGAQLKRMGFRAAAKHHANGQRYYVAVAVQPVEA